jgi:integrase/recombinase XerD
MPPVGDEHITVEPVTLRDARKAYILHCRAAGKARNTVEVYERVTSRLVDWARGQGVENILDVDRDHLRAFFLHLQADHNKGGIVVYYAPIKAMFRWYWSEYEIERSNPVDRVKIERPKVKPKPGVPVESFARMRDACHGRYKLRDVAILDGLLDTCARASEFCALRVKDINFVTGRAWIEAGKGDKSRAVRLGDRSLRELRKYLKTRGELKPNDPLFMNDDRAAFDRFGLRSLVKRRAGDAGLPCPGLHDFRRRGAYLMWKKTRDLKAVSEYLGHSSPVVTQRYLALEEEDVQDMHRDGSPVDNLDW